MLEEWRDIPNVGGRFVRYQVSSLGSVRHITEDGKSLLLVLRLSLVKHKRRHYVRLTTEKGKKVFYVDDLVAEAFLGERKGRVIHLNGDTTDDKAENLSYCKEERVKTYDIFLDGVPLAIGVRGNYPREAFFRWYHAMCDVLDFEKTYGQIDKRKKITINGKTILIENGQNC